MIRALIELARVAPRWRIVALCVLALFLGAGWIGILAGGLGAVINGMRGEHSMTAGRALDALSAIAVAAVPWWYRSELVGVIAILMFWKAKETKP